jgi:hypothetical protein
MPNSLDAQNLFRNSSEYLEIYQTALENVAGQFNGLITNQAFFDADIKPTLINDQTVRIYTYKRLLSEMILFNPYVKFNLAKLAMAAAVFGETPQLLLSVNTEGKLNPILESDILRVVSEQFVDNNLLIQLLNQNIFKISVVFN